MTSLLTDQQRARQAHLAAMRQELLAAADAIVGYAELLEEEAGRIGRDEVLADLGRLIVAARGLYEMVDGRLAADRAEELFAAGDISAAERALRHDLRNPLNAIKGYGEMLLEDLEDLGDQILAPDVNKLLVQVSRLLSRLNKIVDFSRLESEPSADEPATAISPANVDLLRAFQSVGGIEAAKPEPGHILVVDDIEANRDLLSRRLGRDGHRVAVAEGGEAALRLLQEQDFDLLLLDLMMPGMNGYEVLARMKADSDLYEIPVIMISALDEMDTVIRCIEAGAEDYLPKPFDPVLLRARINACLEKKRWREREHLYLDQLEAEKAKNEKLLLSILPSQVVGRLNDGEVIIADRFDDVSVLISDLVGFTEFSAVTPPAELVEYLNWLFSHFDILAGELGVEKVKTIGDAYMVVAGMPQPRDDHAKAVARMAQGMIETLEKVNADVGQSFRARIGIHSGPVVAGIVGTHRFVYDVWGDTVNVASRLEAASLPNRVQVSEVTAGLLGRDFGLDPRGDIEIKGKGRMKTFFLDP
ncbi:MAG: adenylate/guanylate cyclase domain-containing protein [Alphaproteobacteria bacterium]|nr:adenylate/guanylate cyclase domain-containing protein [Alphaproteobacteria bacterium]